MDLWVLRGFSEPSVSVEDTMAVVKVGESVRQAIEQVAQSSTAAHPNETREPPWSKANITGAPLVSTQLRCACGLSWHDSAHQTRHNHRQPELRRVLPACQALVDEGKVKYVGLANCTADELRRAHAVQPISAIEVEWSLCARHNEVRRCAAACLPLTANVSFRLRDRIIAHFLRDYDKLSAPTTANNKLLHTAKIPAWLARSMSSPWPGRSA